MLEFEAAMSEVLHIRSYTSVLVALIVIAAASVGCNRKAPPQSEAGSAGRGEPDHYSATIIRSIDDGQTTAVSVSTISRMGVSTREDWSEGNQKRALICRPDLGKSFLLDLDRRLFVELTPGARAERLESGTGTPATSTKQQTPEEPDTIESGTRAGRAMDPESLDLSLTEADDSSPVVQRGGPDEVLDGYRCRVEERRVVLANGSSETTRWFRAMELGGLALRVESETQSESGRVRVVTERRDVRTDVSPDVFSVPSDFRKVSSLPQ